MLQTEGNYRQDRQVAGVTVDWSPSYQGQSVNREAQFKEMQIPSIILATLKLERVSKCLKQSIFIVHPSTSFLPRLQAS